MIEYEKYHLENHNGGKYDYQFQARDYAIKKYGFAVLTENAINRLLQYCPILEVGAGIGYWAFEFQKRKADYIATDKSSKDNVWFKGSDSELWTSVEPLNAYNAVKKYSIDLRSLLFCWPSYSEDWAGKALEIYKGNIVIDVGEGNDGYTGDEDYYKILNKDWKMIEEVGIPQWWGIHDIITIYGRK